MLSKRLAVLAIAVTALLCLSVPAVAQIPVTTGGGSAEVSSEEALQALSSQLSPAQIDEQLAGLTDEEIRELFRLQLQRSASERGEQEQRTIAESLQARFEQLGQNWSSLGETMPQMPAAFSSAYATWTEDGSVQLWRIALFAAIWFAIGCAVEWLFRRATSKVCERVENAKTTGVPAMVGRIAMRGLLDVLAIGAFAAGSLGGILIVRDILIAFDIQAGGGARLAVFVILAVIVIARLGRVLMSFVIAPDAPDLRLARLSDRAAKTIYNWLTVWVLVYAAGNMFTLAMAHLGLSEEGQRLLLVGSFGADTLVLLAFIWVTRADMRSYLLGADEAGAASTVRRSFADLWPILASLYLAFAWFCYALGAAGLLTLLYLLLLVPILDIGLKNFIRYCVDAKSDEDMAALTPPPPPLDVDEETEEQFSARQAAEKERTDAEFKNRVRLQYAGVFQRFVRVILFVGSLVLVANAAGIDLQGFVESGGFAGRAFGASVDILLTLMVADLIWNLVKTAIDSRLEPLRAARAAAGHSGDEGGVAGEGARMHTLLPLFRKFVMVTLAVMVTMIIMSSLGVDIGPLLAGAGVVGLAIGFGAQTLVRDIVSGVFFLMDDAFRVGEYIEVGPLRGSVEQMSIRSIRLRHHRGAIHTIPFGEMGQITNYSRDWVILKLEFRVPFDTDVTLVKKLVKRIGVELLEDPTHGHSFLEPLKSQGVRRMEDDAMIIGLKFMAKPGEQFTLRREVYQRVRDAFERNGIDLAPRKVEVHVAKDATDEEIAQAAEGAAAEAVTAQAQAAKTA